MRQKNSVMYIFSGFEIPYKIHGRLKVEVGSGHNHVALYFKPNHLSDHKHHEGFPGGTVAKNPPANAGAQVRSLIREDPKCYRATKPVCHSY